MSRERLECAVKDQQVNAQKSEKHSTIEDETFLRNTQTEDPCIPGNDDVKINVIPAKQRRIISVRDLGSLSSESYTNEYIKKIGEELKAPDRPPSEKIKAYIEQIVIGQPEACEAVANQLASVEAGTYEEGKPKGVYYFSGPSGVGKSEMGRAIILYIENELVDDPRTEHPRLLKLKMGGLTQRQDVSRITGSAPGLVGNEEKCMIRHDWLNPAPVFYENGQEKEKLEKRPRNSVIIFDEFDKAHPAVWPPLLHMIDDGVLDTRDGKNGFQILDFRNAHLIFATNDAQYEMEKARKGEGRPGFWPNDDKKAIEEIGKEGVQERYKFMPEFLEKIDPANQIVFRPLTREAIGGVFNKFFRLKNKGTEINNKNLMEMGKTPRLPFIHPSEELKEYVLDHAYNGRKVNQIVQNVVYKPLGNFIHGRDLGNKVLFAAYESGRVKFYSEKAGSYIEEQKESPRIH